MLKIYKGLYASQEEQTKMLRELCDLQRSHMSAAHEHLTVMGVPFYHVEEGNATRELSLSERLDLLRKDLNERTLP